MAKTGLLYYSVDTDRYQDRRIKRLRKDFGCNGVAVYDFILCEIYRVRGCFLEWDDSTAFDVADYFGLKESVINEIVRYCGVVGLFNSGLLSCGIITSLSIQKRYLDACKRSKRTSYKIPDAINLFVETPEEIPKPPEESAKLPEEPEKPPEDSEQKKRKEKKREENKTIVEFEPLTILTFEEFWDLYDKKVGDKEKLSKKWEKVCESDRAKISEHIPKYKLAQPNKKYRKNPETFLNNKSWNDEIIQSNETTTTNSKLDTPEERDDFLRSIANGIERGETMRTITIR